MSFVTASDFETPPFQLNNLDKVVNTFADFVTQYEEEQLLKLMGTPLYDAMVAGLAVTPTPEVRWTKLRDGETYEYAGYEYTWVGLKALLKPFIYAMWLRDNVDYSTGTGIVMPANENSIIVNPSVRICRGYNKFSKISGGCGTMQDTLYGYLYNSGETFTDSLSAQFTDVKQYVGYYFEDPGTMNIYGL